ncbi:hypothetical protein VKT23_018164 [Stygiomarasmius scandens]|uniref:receptor protein-tyrosine kinase n=1 Tax=Marasmiellus scandens TaxID=2682957 RepID=A0ABR1IUB1_9AGAR
MSVPSTWRKPNVTGTIQDSVQTAKGAIDRYLGIPVSSNLSDDDWATFGHFLVDMAEFDILTNQTLYKDKLQDYFLTTKQQKQNFSSEFHPIAVAVPHLDSKLIDGLTYGFAATRAYVAYHDDVFLQYALDSWNSGRDYTISDANIEAALMPPKTVELISECDGVTMAGGTFLAMDPGGVSVTSLSTGGFMALSASLYSITSNQTYLAAAMQSAQFLQAHLTQNGGDISIAISAWQNQNCLITFKGSTADGTGVSILGLTMLSLVMKNSTFDELLRSVTVKALNNIGFQDVAGDGIMNVTAGPSGYYMPRALLQLYTSLSLPDLQGIIGGYLGVQYNAVVDNARSTSSTDPDVYSNSWKQPSVTGTTFQPSNQVLAISALLPGIVLAVNNPGQSTSSSNSPISTSSQPQSPSSRPLLGSILGGVLGGVFLLSLLGAAAFVYVRRRRANRERRRFENYIEPLQPPTLTVSSLNVESSKHQHPHQPSDFQSSVSPTFTDLGSQLQSVSDMSTTQLIGVLRQRLTVEELNSSVTDPPPEYHSL